MPDSSPDAIANRSAHELPYRDEVKRKALHLAALTVPLVMALLGRTWALAVLVPAALLALAGDALRAYWPPFTQFIRRVVGPLMRADEWQATGATFSINGATWVLLSAVLLTFVFPLDVAVPAFVMFMVSDAAAALVGRRFGRLRWGHGPRTMEGSAAFFVVGLMVMACFPSVPFWVGAAGTACACAAEALPRPLNDNLRVPLVAAAAMALLEGLVLDRTVDLFL